MKPWEESWDNVVTDNVETGSMNVKKPWEENWNNEAEINVADYNGTYLIGNKGEDVKPFEKMKMFMDRLFTFKVKTGAEVEEKYKNNKNIQAAEKIKNEGFDDVEWGEVGKAAVRGTFKLGKNLTAEPLKMYGDWVRDKRDVSMLSKEEADKVKMNNFTADSFSKVGGYIEKLWDWGLEAEWLKEDEKIFAGDFVNNPSITRVLSLGTSAIPSLAFGGGIAKITGSPTLAAVMLSGADSTDIYWGAREAGKSQNEALGLFAAGTAGTAVFEKYGLDTIYDKKIMPFSKRVVMSVLSEGLTEGTQTAYQNMVKKYGYDDTQLLMEGVVESMIGGAIGGGAMSAAYGGYAKLRQARENISKKGLEDSDLDVIQEGFAREISQHRDTIESLFQKNINKSLNTLEKFVAENEGTAEAQKALQTKQELEQVYTDVFEGLKKTGMNENIANADAKIWQGMALFGAQETGLSPLEYIRQRMPKVERMTFEQFQNRETTLEEELDDYIPYQAMYKSKLPNFGAFYDDIIKNENTKDRYFTEDMNGIGLDIPRNAIRHDANKHGLTKEEWQGIFESIRNGGIKEARMGDYSRMHGMPVKMVVDVNGVEYGVAFERMKNGRNLVNTAFKIDDKGWINEKQKKKSSQAEASEPLPKSRRLGSSMSDIISVLDENVNSSYQEASSRPKGAYLQNLDRNGVIYLFEKADASTFMHETAHFFRKELKGFNTARSREMLKNMDEWENQEFDKRYKLKEENGTFVVTDKIGNVVYGAEKPFFDAGTARYYAKNEIFARGFEQYLREGKAPNNYLKQAFRSFWNWLRHIYKAATDLNVDVNDDIRAVYGDIIGGKDLDFYLSAPVDEVLQQHFDEKKDRKRYLDEQIRLAQAQPIKRNFTANLARERTDGAKGRNEWWNKAVIPISTRAKRVNIKLRNKLRAYDYGVNTKLNRYYAQIKPFLDKWATMTETDAVAFDLALKNSYVEKQLEIVNKYGAYDEFVAVKNLLNSLFDQAVDVGIELGYTADYFPRQIDDVDGFMAYIYGSSMASQLRRALRAADPENVMTNEERAAFFDKYLRGFNRKDLNKPLPGNTKDRSIDIVTAEMNKYYKTSMQALINYVDGMNASIESRRFWGFKYDDINQSIGALTANLVDSGVIAPEQDYEVQNILRARFKDKGVTNKWLNLQKNVSYIYTMGGINSAITQIDDISMSLYKAGLWNTVQSVFSKNRPGLSREELGLERIGQEFAEASASSQAVNAVFKLTGLDKIDAFGKNTLINATFNKFQKMAQRNPEELRKRIESVMEQETEQTIEDIKNGVVSENVKLLMFNELADVQPISLSEMPEWYLTSGNGRVFYMLKTFTIKRLDIFRNECFDKIRDGKTKEGIQNLFRLAIFMILCGASKDAIIDMLFGRDFGMTDTMVNNVLGLAGISKYSLYKARDEGFTGFASSFIIPPVFAPTSDLLSDIYKSLFSKKGKDISDYEIWKGVPLIGRFYYWWLGGGKAKQERKKKKKLK